LKLAHLARDWSFVVGTPVGVVFIIARQTVFGLVLIALSALSAYVMHRAAQRARQTTQAGKPTGRGSAILLVWGQILVLLNFLWLALFSDIAAQAFLLIATLPPGIMAIVAWYQLRRTNDARVSR